MPAPPSAPERAVIAGLTLEGLGVVRGEGKRVLVHGALPGEDVEYQRTRRRSNYDEARLLAVHAPSADRVEPRCSYFGRCGGCALQHLAPAAQLAAKETTLLESLSRIGGVRPAQVLPPVAGETWGYRRRVRFSVRDVQAKGRVLVGFQERERPWVMDMDHCETAHPLASALLPALSALAGSLSIRHRVPQFEVTVADNAVAVVARTLLPLTPDDDRRLEDFAADTQGLDRPLRLYVQPGDGRTLVPVGAAARDPSPLEYALPARGLRLAFGPTDFIQVNAAVNAALVEQALAALDLRPTDRVLDLFAGIGNFSLPLAQRAAAVVGIEGAAPAVEWARRNAASAGLANAEFVVADLAGDGLGGAWARGRYDLALLDPPRAGARELLAPLAATGVRRIVYVSCHPGTLARDAGILVGEHGFALEAAGVLDMFPQTSHVESMAVFSRTAA
ncbi:MAG: 23S rRNA (uracil(1939)-C(5))-methyltransferase RlmD [Chromatiales bacterium]|nr:23S rRNA (uracil(1939)-C(5))-methyltransferase RlmD [Chromatiales bacterium]